MATQLPRDWSDIRHEWAILTFYERFETLIAFLLRVVIGLVVAVAFYRLTVSVIDTLVLRSLNPLDHTVFQHVFGEVMTLLIALSSITRSGTPSATSVASFRPRSSS